METYSGGTKIGIKNDSHIMSAMEKNDESPEQHTKLMRSLDAIVTMSLVAIFFGLPLFFLNFTFQGIAFEKQIYFYFWLLIALVAWMSKAVIIGEIRIKRSMLDYPLLGMWLIYLIATIFSVDRWHSLWGFFGDPSRGFISITVLIIAFYLIHNHGTIKRLWWMGGALTFSGTIVAVWAALGLMNVSFLPKIIAQAVPLSLIGSLSGLGIFLSLMVLVLMTVILLVASQKWARWLRSTIITFGLFSLLVHLFVLFALYAFVPWPGLLVGISFFLIYILVRIVRPPTRWVWLPMVSFVVVFVLLMVGQSTVARVTLPVDITPNYSLSWQIAQASLAENFFLGSGPTTYGYDFSLYRPQTFNANQFFSLRFYQGTGILFEALPTVGVLGTVAIFLVLVTFVSVSIYLLSRDREKNKIASLGFFAASVTAIVDILLTHFDGVVLLLSVLIGTLAFVMLHHQSNVQSRSSVLSLKAAPKFALTLAFIFMVVSAGVAFLFVFIGKIFIADLHAGKASRADQITEEGSVQSLARAIQLNTREGRYFMRLGQEYMVLANREALKGETERSVDKIKIYLNNSIASAVRARTLMPHDVLAVETLGQVYENASLYVSDSRDLAEQTYKDAQDLEPHNPQLFTKRGQLRLAAASAEKDEGARKTISEEARSVLEGAIAEKVDFAPAHYQLALAKEALGDFDGAIENMNNAAVLDAQNINYVFNLGRLYQARGEGEDNIIAEALFKRVLGVNDSEINTYFSLGLLYEKTKRLSEAVDAYKTVLRLLPEDAQEARARVEEMIRNVEGGVGNVPDSSTQSESKNPLGSQEENINNKPLGPSKEGSAPNARQDVVTP